jgi:hypothetical protein
MISDGGMVMDLRNFLSRVLGGCGSKCVVEKIFRRRPETNFGGRETTATGLATRLDSHTTRGTLRVLCTIVPTCEEAISSSTKADIQ